MSADRPLRLAFLTWCDLRHPDGGGSEVYVHEIAAEWVRAGHEVTIVTARPPGTPATELVDGILHRRRGGRLTVYLHGLVWLVGPGRRHDAVIDVVNGLPFAAPLVRRRGLVALVHHVHREQWRMIYPGWPGRLGWFVESQVTPRLYRRVPHVTVSDASARDLVRLGIPAGRITVVRAGLSARPSYAGRSTSPRLCVLARLVPHKQIEHLLRLTALLRSEFPDLDVDVVGDGWWASQLHAEARRLGVTDLVTFHGHVGDEERDRLLASAWLMVLPSIKEGWGIAVTEAAAQGTPTVGYRTSGGLTESVTDGVTGWLVDDFPELVERVRALLRSPMDRENAARDGVEAASSVTWPVAADRFAEVVRSAAAQRSP